MCTHEGCTNWLTFHKRCFFNNYKYNSSFFFIGKNILLPRTHNIIITAATKLAKIHKCILYRYTSTFNSFVKKKTTVTRLDKKFIYARLKVYNGCVELTISLCIRSETNNIMLIIKKKNSMAQINIRIIKKVSIPITLQRVYYYILSRLSCTFGIC